MDKEKTAQHGRWQPLTAEEKGKVARFLDAIERDQERALANGEIDPSLNLSKLVLESRDSHSAS